MSGQTDEYLTVTNSQLERRQVPPPFSPRVSPEDFGDVQNFDPVFTGESPGRWTPVDQ